MEQIEVVKSINRYVCDGNVAIIIAPGYSDGWSTIADPSYRKQLMFDSELVQSLLSRNYTNFNNRVISILGDEHSQVVPPEQLVVHWIPVQSVFEIQVHHGKERVHVFKKQLG